MNLFLRLIWHFIAARYRAPCEMMGPCITPFHVWPSDLDLLGHVNNGVYFSMLDVARVDLMIRSGLWRKIKENGIYPVIAAETMRFRRSLHLFERFTINTRVIGWDDKAFLLEQRFLRASAGAKGDEVVAEGIVRARFLKKAGGVIPPAVILGFAQWSGPSPDVDAWIASWNRAQNLSRDTLQTQS
ncbi:MAG: acyl-CoA thioesterase [Hyphomicrobiales bacterium]|nr:acyl-CoA thioesterase [Hyphomicrobiales bacterium]